MSSASEARRLLRSHRYGALSTLSKKLDGFPFGSITPYLVDHDGSLLILISALAEHSKNIRHDPRVSLITHNQSDPRIQMQGRVTVAGHAQQLPDQQQAVARYLRHFPEASDLLTLDFAFYRIRPVAIRYIGGVGRIHWLNLDNYLAPHAAYFAQNEEKILNKINTQQTSTLRDLLSRHGMEASDAQLIGLDCDGLSFLANEQFWRLDFAETLNDLSQLDSLHSLQYQQP